MKIAVFAVIILYATGALGQSRDEIKARNMAISWELEARGKQNGQFFCNVKAITPRGRTSDGAAYFWVNIECLNGSGRAGSSGGWEVYCGLHLQRVIRSSMFDAVCHER